MRKIYVTGLGVISGIGKGVEENLDSLKAGKHGMGKITLFPTALDVPVSEVKQSNEELKKRMFFQTRAKVVKFRFIVNKKRKL